MPGRHNEALMELGATLCLPVQARCEACPVADLCQARARGIADQLPVAKKKKPPKQVRMFALVARKKGLVLVGQRLEGGLFGGMWEPPMVELVDGDEPGRRLADLLGAKPLRLLVLGEQTHTLTHRKLCITIAQGTVASLRLDRSQGDYQRFAWVSQAELAKVGVSSLARKVLAACPG